MRQILAATFLIGNLCATGCNHSFTQTSKAPVEVARGIPTNSKSAYNRPTVRDPDQITQISVINALMVGQYDGVMSVGEMLQFGDFGLGTLDHLDGELIVLEGKVYQIRGNGEIVEVSPQATTPFAAITPFDVDGQSTCPQVNSLSALDTHLNQAIPQKNNFVAVRVDARFAAITMRSVRRQEPPYKPLAEVAKSQSVWTREHVSGTMIGIRSPSWVVGLSVPGYHWHFLSDDHKFGGHVLDCKIVEGRVQHDLCDNWLIKLQTTPDFNKADIGQDLSRELHKVESSRGTEKD